MLSRTAEKTSLVSRVLYYPADTYTCKNILISGADIIKKFLWMSLKPNEASESEGAPCTSTGPSLSSAVQNPETKATDAKSQKSKAKKQKPENVEKPKPSVTTQKPTQECDKNVVETREEMYN